MTTASLPFFDRLAARYDETWTNSPAGRTQRNAVWRELDPRVKPGDRILDLGCGTGEDAQHYSMLGANVDAVDSSPAMVEAARVRGIDARLLAIEDTSTLTGPYDLALSNFGALNCVAEIDALRDPLLRLIRPGGVLAICFMSRFCLWETIYHGLRGRLAKASRRWSGAAQVSGDLRVFYPSARRIAHGFSPGFRLRRDLGIGVSVPPAYVHLNSQACERRDRFDRRIAQWRIARSMSDHRLLIFTRDT